MNETLGVFKIMRKSKFDTNLNFEVIRNSIKFDSLDISIKNYKTLEILIALLVCQILIGLLVLPIKNT